MAWKWVRDGVIVWAFSFPRFVGGIYGLALTLAELLGVDGVIEGRSHPEIPPHGRFIFNSHAL